MLIGEENLLDAKF